jgi:hypothetical protein
MVKNSVASELSSPRSTGEHQSQEFALRQIASADFNQGFSDFGSPEIS